MSWVEVAQFANPIAAEIARGLLEAHGIQVQLRQEGAARALGIYVGGFGEIVLLVPEEEAERAQDLLQAWQRGDLEDALPPWMPDGPNGDPK